MISAIITVEKNVITLLIEDQPALIKKEIHTDAGLHIVSASFPQITENTLYVRGENFGLKEAKLKCISKAAAIEKASQIKNALDEFNIMAKANPEEVYRD